VSLSDTHLAFAGGFGLMVAFYTWWLRSRMHAGIARLVLLVATIVCALIALSCLGTSFSRLDRWYLWVVLAAAGLGAGMAATFVMVALGGVTRRLLQLSKGLRRTVGVLIVPVAITLGVTGVAAGMAVRGSAPDDGLLMAYALLSVPAGIGLFRLAKRFLAATIDERLARDPRPPVLYLRSFVSDTEAARIKLNIPLQVPMHFATEEEQLAMVLTQFGPPVAVGRPGEWLPRGGATRVEMDSDGWKQGVSDLASRARLVVVRAGVTAGLAWEVEMCVREVPRDRLVLLLPRRTEDWDRFAAEFGKLFSPPLPEYSPKRWFERSSSSIGGVLWFDAGGTPHLELVEDITRLTRQGHVIAIELEKAIRPLKEHLKIPGVPRQRAPVGPRFAAMVIDVAILAAAFRVATLVDPVNGWAIALVFAVLYFVGFELSPLRATPGKRMMGLELRDDAGVPATLNQIIMRLLALFMETVTMIGLLASTLWVLNGRKALRDRLSSTDVVRG
jgi:uncharacterized RDD family membrane protein YckC